MKKIILVLLISFFSITSTFANLNYSQKKEIVSNKINFPVYSPKGELTYITYENGKHKLIKSGKTIVEYTNFFIRQFKYSPDGKHLAYIIEEKKGRNKKSFVIRDGKKSKGYSFINGLQYSPDSKHLLYFANYGELNNGNDNRIVSDGIESKYSPFNSLGQYSPNSLEYSYKARNYDGDREKFLIRNGKKISSWEGQFAYSNDGKKFAYTTDGYGGNIYNNGKKYIYKDYTTPSKINNYTVPYFSNNGDLFYITKINKKEFLVKNGNLVSKGYDFIDSVRISNKGVFAIIAGSNIGYLEGKRKLIINGKEKKTSFDMIKSIQFKENGNYNYIAYNKGEDYDNTYFLVDNNDKVILKTKDSLGFFWNNIEGINCITSYYNKEKGERYSRIIYNNGEATNYYNNINEKIIINNTIIFTAEKDKKHYLIIGNEEIEIKGNIHLLKYSKYKNSFFILFHNLKYGEYGREEHIYTIREYEINNKFKPIPKIDRVLNKFFVKVDKKGEVKSKALYNKIIKKIDLIISKTKSSKKKKLLEYIKVKFEEKVK